MGLLDEVHRRGNSVSDALPDPPRNTGSERATHVGPGGVRLTGCSSQSSSGGFGETAPSRGRRPALGPDTTGGGRADT